MRVPRKLSALDRLERVGRPRLPVVATPINGAGPEGPEGPEGPQGDIGPEGPKGDPGAGLPEGVTDWGLVSALPGSPAKGDRCHFIADKANGVIWHLIYDGEGTYPWKAVGGKSLYIRSATNVTGVSTTAFTSFASACKLTTPLNGDYDVDWGAGAYNESGNNSILGLVVNGSAPSYPEGDDAPFAGAGAAIERSKRVLGVEAAKIIEVKYRVSGGSAGQFRSPFLRIDPVRVG